MADGLPYNSPFEAQFDPGRAQDFIITQLLRGIHTATLVRVLAVRPASASVGVLDVEPLVLEQDTSGAVIAQTPIYNVPYLRYQGGVSAVILDPAVGDKGLCIFAERDIRDVKTTLAPAAAASDRMHSSADGLYIGGVLNGAPTQFVEFLASAGGLKVTTPATLTATAAALVANIDGAATLTTGGNLTANVGGNATVDVTGTADVSAASATVTATGTITLAAPAVIINGNLQVNGSIAQAGGGGGGTAVFSAPIQAPQFTGAGGVNLTTHTHPVTTAPGTTGGPSG